MKSEETLALHYHLNGLREILPFSFVQTFNLNIENSKIHIFLGVL